MHTSLTLMYTKKYWAKISELWKQNTSQLLHPQQELVFGGAYTIIFLLFSHFYDSSTQIVVWHLCAFKYHLRKRAQWGWTWSLKHGKPRFHPIHQLFQTIVLEYWQQNCAIETGSSKIGANSILWIKLESTRMSSDNNSCCGVAKKCEHKRNLVVVLFLKSSCFRSKKRGRGEEIKQQLNCILASKFVKCQVNYWSE